MPRVNAAEFSRIAGVSKVAISKLVNATPPKLIVVDGKLDTENPINKMYLERPHDGGRLAMPKPPTPRPTKGAPAQKPVKAMKAKTPKPKKVKDADPDDTDLDDIDAIAAQLADGDHAELLIRKLKADIAYKEESADKLALDKEERKGNLIRRDMVIDKIQAISKALSDHVNRQHAKTGPVLFSIAKLDGSTELEVTRRLEVDYGDAIRRALEEISQVAN